MRGQLASQESAQDQELRAVSELVSLALQAGQKSRTKQVG